MYNRWSGLVASALMLMLMINQMSHSQSEAAEAAKVPATVAPHANKTDTTVFTEGGSGVDVAVAGGAASSPKNNKGSVKKPEAKQPDEKDIKINENGNNNVTKNTKPTPMAAKLPNSNLPIDQLHINDMDIPGQAFFYILVGITSTAVVLLVVRVYRLRLSRAERKYGVQGDRANQELTPLPMAIEDVNSDEEDHTVFEVNRQNIRIL